MYKWTKRFLDLAWVVAGWSKDPSTQCGAVITDYRNRVISLGFNGYPRHVKDKGLSNREQKYLRIIHAEENAILFAQRDLKDCIMYVVPMPPCSLCAGKIIQAGIKKVITVKPKTDVERRWEEKIKVSCEMFNEAEVDIVLI